MSEPNDPRRLHDDPATSEELRDVIGALREGGRDERSRATIAAGLGSLLAEPAAPPGDGAGGSSPPGGSGGMGTSGASRLLPIAGGVTGAIVLLALLLSATSKPKPVAAPAERDSVEPSVGVPVPTRTPAEPVEAEPAPTPAEPEPAAQAARVRTAAARPAPPAEPTPAEPRSEIALLREARAAVTSQPSRALALCGDHQRHYPNGVLGEEREVIAVKALLALGRVGDAQRRGRSFLRTHESSAHRARIEALLEEARQENDPAAR